MKMKHGSFYKTSARPCRGAVRKHLHVSLTLAEYKDLVALTHKYRLSASDTLRRLIMDAL